MQHVFQVEFTRELGDDEEIANERYPTVQSLDERLTKQCQDEIDANPELKTRVVVGNLENLPNNQYRLSAIVFWLSNSKDREVALQEFRAQLQRTYDEFGMAGRFNISDRKG